MVDILVSNSVFLQCRVRIEELAQGDEGEVLCGSSVVTLLNWTNVFERRIVVASSYIVHYCIYNSV